jgi:hypothetical protein
MSDRGGVVIFFGIFIVFGIAMLLEAIRATLDAANLLEDAFRNAGANRTVWIILPLLGLSLGAPGLIATIWWFVRIKPKVTAVMVATPAPPSLGTT